MRTAKTKKSNRSKCYLTIWNNWGKLYKIRCWIAFQVRSKVRKISRSNETFLWIKWTEILKKKSNYSKLFNNFKNCCKVRKMPICTFLLTNRSIKYVREPIIPLKHTLRKMDLSKSQILNSRNLQLIRH